MSNIDEYGWSSLPDDVVDCGRARREYEKRFEKTELPDVAPDEVELVQKWRSWGFSWRDVSENLEILRAKQVEIPDVGQK